MNEYIDPMIWIENHRQSGSGNIIETVRNSRLMWLHSL